MLLLTSDFFLSGREDFSGIDNEALDFTDLEDYLNNDGDKNGSLPSFPFLLQESEVAAVAEWYRYRTVACFVTGSSPVPLKTRLVGQRCTLNLSRAETSSRWCGVVVRRGGCQLRCRPRHLTMVQNYVVRRQKPSCS
ncbi:uncharacterized protein TNCV_3491981 [Trichonephila clavipes]|nr:uncharacterized protein TNCV_3491981 [Trichonephila clavipes]